MSSETDSPLKVTKYKPGTHPNSQKNLEATKFPKGVSGNAGSGNGYSLTAALKHALKDKKLLRAFIESTIEGAIAREPTPFREVWERVDGKIPDAVNTTNIDNRTVNIIVSSDKAKTLTESVGNRLAPLQVDNNIDDTQYIGEGEN